MRSDMIPGAVFPDYELPDHTTKRRKLSELQGQHPMVVVLGRGGYCPKDRRQHELLLQLHSELEVGYCRLVTISTDNITETNEFRTGVGAHWPFLSDPARKIQKDLDIAEYTDSDHNPMIPIVLEPVWSSIKFTMATGSLVDPLRKISARICERLRKNAGQIGTLQRPSSKLRGSKGVRNFSTHTARLTSKPWANKHISSRSPFGTVVVR